LIFEVVPPVTYAVKLAPIPEAKVMLVGEIVTVTALTVTAAEAVFVVSATHLAMTVSLAAMDGAV